jgi:ankyrin repeat protein
MSIIPPLLQREKLSELNEATKTQLAEAKTLRRNRRYKEAESQLWWLASDAAPKFQEPAVRSLGELYRKAVRSKDPFERDFGMKGFEKFSKITATTKRPLSKTSQETINTYEAVWKYFKHKDRAVGQNYEKSLPDVDQLTRHAPQYRALMLTDKVDLSKLETVDLMKILDWAIQHNCSELVEDLWDVARILANKPDDSLQRPPFWGVKRNCDVETLEALLDWPDVNLNLTDNKLRTCFLFAVEMGNLGAVDLLIKHGADIRAKDDQNRDAVLLAAEIGHKDVLKRLLLAKVEPNASGKDHDTALHKIVAQNENDMVPLLLKHGANTEAEDAKGRTPLFLAVEKGDEDAVEMLLEGRANAGAGNKKHRGLLHLAIESDTSSERMVKLLLNYGTNTTLENGDGQTPLERAAEKGLAQTVRQLLGHLSTGVYDGTQGSSWCDRPLRRAAETGDSDVIQLILGYTNDVDTKDEHGRTPFLLAVQNSRNEEGIVPERYLGVAEQLLRAGADVNAITKTSSTALHYAAQWGLHKMAVLLLKFGTDVELRDAEGLTPLALTVEKGSFWKGQREVVELLLLHHANPNARGGIFGVPLQAASYRGQEEIVLRLLNAKADVSSKCGKYGTALQAAATSWDGYEAAKVLLRAGADVNAKGGEYGSPLQAALRCGREVTMGLLLEHGADKESKDWKAQTPLCFAVESGSMAVVETLLKYEVSTETQDEQGCTPLLLAVKKDHKGLVELLLRHGANAEAQDKQGRTAFLLAVEKRHDEIATWLMQNGSDINVEGGLYGCALQAALYQGNEDMAERLKQAGARRPTSANQADSV